VTHPLALYADGLRGAVPGSMRLRLLDGRTLLLPLDRYVSAPDAVDRALLTGLDGPVLDVGCGPGRHLRALAARGVFALGVDLSPAAVRLATGSGARAIVASIFDELPGAGTWRTALLLDGNIGIGGSPIRLLRRIATLLSANGAAVVELAPDPSDTFATLARLEHADSVSRWFPWAWVSVRDIERLAAAAGLRCERMSSIGGRLFAVLG
jgi:SAM-dependent methyltransferase